MGNGGISGVSVAKGEIVPGVGSIHSAVAMVFLCYRLALVRYLAVLSTSPDAASLFKQVDLGRTSSARAYRV
jgi:hypothetical protein